MLQKNQIIEGVIEALSHEGAGIARHEGMAVFVPTTAVGDRLRIKVVKVLASRACGIVHQLVARSPHRVENDCPAFPRCGGCALRHISYEAEAAQKGDWLRENLARIGGVSPELEPPMPSPASARYRNKAQFPVREAGGEIRVGFFAGRSHALIPVEDCLLQPAFFADICAAVIRYMEQCGVRAYDEASHRGAVRHIYLRHAAQTGQVMVCLAVNADSLPQTDMLLKELCHACPAVATVATVVLSHNRKQTNVILGDRLTVLSGAGKIEDVLCGVRVRISPLSFYQVNRDAAELLYREALRYAAPDRDDLLLDLYCGAGTIGLSMAHAVKRVVGVETVPQAVDDARRAALENDIGNTRFLRGDAARAADELRKEGLRPDIVVLDPPRKGADPALLRTMADMAPRKIVYISCNSATLSRDAKQLLELGYAPVRARAVDLFPRTAHAEAVMLLERRSVVSKK